MPSNLDIRNITNEDIKDVIIVHNSAFKNFFLTNLGSQFLRLYYNSVMKSPNGILIGAFLDDKLLGFCAATTHSTGFNSSLIKDNIIQFSIIGLKLLFTRPKAIIRLIKNLSKKGNSEDNGDYAELMSIAVDERYQNCGAGKVLVEELEKILKNMNIRKLSLTTDILDNENTLAFYNKRGFEKMYEFTTYPNRRMYRLIKNL